MATVRFHLINIAEPKTWKWPFLGQNYFNAIRRIDFNVLRQKMSPGDFHAFICTHIVGATKEVRPGMAEGGKDS